MAQVVKNLPAMQETQVPSLVGKVPWITKWQPTPVFLPGKSSGQRSLTIVHGVEESDMTEWLTTTTKIYKMFHTYESKVWGKWNWDRVQFSRSVVSSSLQSHALQQARPPCPSPSPRACSNSCPLSQWCHPTISSSCHPLLLLPLIFPSIRVFSNKSALRIRWPGIGASASTLVLPMSIQDWFPLGLTGLISLQSKALSRVSSNTTGQNHPFFSAQHSLWSNSHIHTRLLEKP